MIQGCRWSWRIWLQRKEPLQAARHLPHPRLQDCQTEHYLPGGGVAPAGGRAHEGQGGAQQGRGGGVWWVGHSAVILDKLLISRQQCQHATHGDQANTFTGRYTDFHLWIYSLTDNICKLLSSLVRLVAIHQQSFDVKCLCKIRISHEVYHLTGKC